MEPTFTDIKDKAFAFWKERNAAQRVLLIGIAGSAILAFGLMMYWVSAPDYKVLYSNLYTEDAGRVVEQLKAQKIKYKLENGGTSIMVPSESVYDLRLKLAGDGAVRGNGLGFELFDEVKIGQTEFVQRINYQRALQGELSRTIAEFPEVDRARVHLVLPHKSLFIEQQAPASASVVVKLKDGKELNKTQIRSIVNLIALSVEGLDKSQITIADVGGKMLFREEGKDSVEGLSMGQLDYRSTLQKTLEQKIEQMLFPVVGQGKVIARVNADVDFSSKTITKQTYDPKSAAVRSEQKSEESNRGRNSTEGGSPDPNFRGDGNAGGLSSQESTRETKTTNFEINKEEQSIVVPVGEIKRLSVAVIVDGKWQSSGAKGAEPTWVALTPEEISRIEDLVKNAVGFETSRGDSVKVSNISFGQPDAFGEPSVMHILVEYLQRLGKPILNATLALLFLLLVVRPVVLNLIKPKVNDEEVEELISLPQVEERMALEEGVEDEVIDMARKLELVKAQAQHLSEKDMDQAVSVLKSWLKQEAA